MKLTIISINLNNVVGLEKTMQSVLSQTCQDIEYLVVDGASTDGSVDVIRRFAESFGERMKWVSEPDTGIYNAMNKGIRMATGEYLQFLNSGDYLAADDVTERMLAELNRQGNPSMLYGNMIKCFPDGRKMLDKSFQGRPVTMLDMYLSSLPHGSTLIQRRLFEKYGLYDESLRIVSDWEWFLQAILGDEQPRYVNINVLLYDKSGVSSINPEINKQERQAILEKLIPRNVLRDYEQYAIVMDRFRGLQRHDLAYRFVCFADRCRNKLREIQAKRKNRYLE